MPLQPIRFNTIDDVYTLLNKLRSKNLLSFRDGGKVIFYPNFEQLKVQFIVATNYETYLLDDVFEMSDEEMLASNLSFLTIEGYANHFSAPIALATDRIKLRTRNASLLHNHPLASVLIQLNPSPGNLLNMPSLFCDVTKKPIIFPVLTPLGLTVEGVERALTIFEDSNIGPDNYGNRPFTVTGMFANTALLDLQRIHWIQLQTFMAQLSNDNVAFANDIRAVIAAKNQVLEITLARVQQVLDGFKTTYPACKTALTDNTAYYRDNMELLQQMGTYRQCIHHIALYSEKISDNKTYTIISAALFWTVIGSMALILNGSDLHRYKKLLAETQVTFRGVTDAKEQFIQDQVAKVYLQIIQPCEALIASLQRMLTQPSPAPAVEKAVVPFQSKSNSLQQFGLMGGQPQTTPSPEPEAMQRFDRKTG